MQKGLVAKVFLENNYNDIIIIHQIKFGRSQRILLCQYYSTVDQCMVDIQYRLEAP